MSRRFAPTTASPFSMSSLPRRAVLQAGVSSLAGISGATVAGALADDVRKTTHAKACIFLFMWGGPSQLDTLDMKPNAPAEVRGEFKPASTVVPGVQVCEHFQQLSQRMDKVAVIRSLTHNDPAHLSSAHATLTGHLARVRPSDAEPPNEMDDPHIGSVLAQLHENHQFRGLVSSASNLPGFVTMPWKAYHPAAPGGQAPGQHGGWLGRTFDPFLLTGDPNAENWSIPALQLLEGTSTGRLLTRQRLLNTIEQQQRALVESGAGRTMTSHQSTAVDFLTSQRVRQAFDLTNESAQTRERYGRNIHGQCVLLARRLVEHGVPMVSVNWHNDGQNFWDTHGNNFNRLKNDLIPPADRALAALLDDLDERGLLDETLIAWVGEFGRRPTITAGNAGREHWPSCYSGLLAGGGIRGGTVYGASDAHAAYPSEFPVSPQDYAATMLHALGIPSDSVLHDRQSRPHRLYAGMPIEALF
ncbi:MAG: DUF1501 domain-containing protein [Rhodopirellula sp.]|nr:DUF1501 domain-containing protein [Rhodopirellula sp.]